MNNRGRKNMRNQKLVGFLVVCFVILLAWSTTAGGQDGGNKLPQGKQTTLELYMTAIEAYEKWRADPKNVRVLDVRTPEEFIFIGHAEMAVNIPVAFQTYQWDADKQHFSLKPNLDFVSQVKAWADSADTILVMCRSGGRSAASVNLLAEAGFKNVYNIIDGMEGDKVDDPENIFHGKRMRNGWKNSGLPWTYDLNPERMQLPKHQ
ncbi:rhodanese-like domain-containing protein [Desulfosarcina sp.]|nr:rhodanese-like domain-containing protein [Desulfosarcina sp.]